MYIPDQVLLDECMTILVQNFKAIKDYIIITSAESGSYPFISS